MRDCQRASFVFLCLTLLMVLGGLTPSVADAQWRTRQGDEWGLRRCQSRNILSGGLVLGASALPLLQSESSRGVGLAVLSVGSAAALAGAGLRIALRSDPGRDSAYARWPEDRCRARNLSIRGGVYLLTSIVTCPTSN